jgi:2-dehydropantoate 2-reductase
VAVLGSGGLGGYFGALLAGAGHAVTFVARGPHLQAIRQQGLQVDSPLGDFKIFPASATDRAAEIGPVDLVLFAVKTYQIEAALPSVPPLLGPATAVLTTENGVDAWQQVAASIGAGRVLPGAVWIASEVAAPGVICHGSSVRRIVFGEPDGKPSPRAESLHAAFQATGAQVEVSTDIQQVLWTKFVFMASYGGVTSVVRLPTAGVRACRETMDLLRRAMTEVERVGRARGIALADDVVDRTMGFVSNLEPEVTTSTQRDVAAGRRLEIEALSGSVVRHGQELGLPTPVHEFLYAALAPVDRWAREHPRPA